MMQPPPEESDFSSGKPLPEEKKSKVILIVDDDEDIVATVASIGRKAGYTVLGASSGEECLAVLWCVTPQLIMLDVNMPNLDGFETCRRIRGYHNFSHVPIAFLTARRTPADVKRCITAGGDDFIVKPFKGTQLVERIEFLMSQHHQLSLRRARRAEKIERRAAPPAVAALPTAGDTSSAEASSKAGPSATPSKNQDMSEDLCWGPEVAAKPLAPFLVKEGDRTGPGLISPSVLPK